VQFHGIDTSDPAQVAGLAKMLDLEKYPTSTADLGIDDRVIVSSLLAEQFGLQVGDKLRLYSTRNFEEVMHAYKATENPPVREAYAPAWKKATSTLAAAWHKEQDGFSIPLKVLRDDIYDPLYTISTENIRKPEQELLNGVLVALGPATNDAAYHFTAEAKAGIEQGIADLNATDAEKMDGDILKGLKSIVLPKEALQTLKVSEGDVLFLTEAPEGSLRITPERPGFEDIMKVAEEGMSRYRNALRELAK